MQKINNLEQWQIKAKQYNPKAGNGWLWAMIFALLLMAFVAPIVHTACISERLVPLVDGDYANGLIQIRLDSEGGDKVVEFIQGGYLGTDRSFCVNVLDREVFDVYLLLNARTAPIFITCHKAVNSSYDADGCWNKNTLNQTFTVFALENQSPELKSVEFYLENNDQNIEVIGEINGTQTINAGTGTFDIDMDADVNIIGLPQLDVTGSIDSNSNITLGDVNISIDNMTIPTDLNVNLTGGVDANLTGGFDLEMTDTNITKSYTNLPADTNNPFILGLAWILFTLGMFLSITFVMQLFKRRE